VARQEQQVRITITIAARRTGLSPRSVRRYVRRGLVSEQLTESELLRLRRIRRLRELGVNLCGVEIILNMRRQIQELQREVARLEAMTPPSLDAPATRYKSLLPHRNIEE
jgi:MerR family transcriptional regulator, heat shock protein HspR